MIRYYFFSNRRVDGRMKLFPLPGQTTYANHGSTAAPEVPVDVETEVQMNILDRALVCSYHDATVFGVRMEGNSRRQIRLMAYTDRGRVYYKAAGIVPILFDSNGDIHTDEDLYNENRNGVHVRPDEQMIAEYRAYVIRQNRRVAEETAPAATEQAAGIAASQAPNAAARPEIVFPVVSAGRMDKVRNIGAHLADLGVEASVRKTNKYLISLLLDIMSVAGAQFKFVKQNGDVREAFGTLDEGIVSGIDPSALEDSRERQGSGGVNDGGHVVYFDIKKRDWRSFCVEDFLGVDLNVRLPLADCVRLASES